MPLVAIAVALRRFGRWLLRLLIRLLDIAFPILLQLMRFPLFTLRIAGDGLAALMRGIVGLLPIGARKAAWRDAIARRWAWMRQYMSYKAFEEALHHAFENGMAWVFRTCRALSPGRALLVLALAALWLPVSFGLATALHAVLFAKVAVWPAWTQLLHPVATVVAKTKLLVLPVYPAAWPQARKHGVMRALIAAWDAFAALAVVQKVAYRFRQVDVVAGRAARNIRDAARQAGLPRLRDGWLAAVNAAGAWLGSGLRRMWSGAVSVLAPVPLIGAVLRHYETHYERANAEPAAPLSERTRDFMARWSEKFTARYYEEKEKAEAAGASPAG